MKELLNLGTAQGLEGGTQWELKKANTTYWDQAGYLAYQVLAWWAQQRTELEMSSRTWVLVPSPHRQLHSNFGLDKNSLSPIPGWPNVLP